VGLVGGGEECGGAVGCVVGEVFEERDFGGGEEGGDVEDERGMGKDVCFVGVRWAEEVGGGVDY
jgi:hypothetical protein